MTVKELIEQLKGLPKDLEDLDVLVYTRNRGEHQDLEVYYTEAFTETGLHPCVMIHGIL